MTLDEAAKMLKGIEGPLLAFSSDGRIIHASDSALDLLGWDASLLGQPLQTILPPRLRSPDRFAIGRYIEAGSPADRTVTVCLPTLLHDGSEVDMDLTLRNVDAGSDIHLLVASMAPAPPQALRPGVELVESKLERRMFELV